MFSHFSHFSYVSQVALRSGRSSFLTKPAALKIPSNLHIYTVWIHIQLRWASWNIWCAYRMNGTAVRSRGCAATSATRRSRRQRSGMLARQSRTCRRCAACLGDGAAVRRTAPAGSERDGRAVTGHHPADPGCPKRSAVADTRGAAAPVKTLAAGACSDYHGEVVGANGTRPHTERRRGWRATGRPSLLRHERSATCGPFF